MTARRLLGVVGLASVLCLPVLADAQETTRGFAPTTIPRTIPIFPLPDVMLFPGATRPLHIFESRYREMVADALEGDRLIGMVLLQPGYEADYTGRPRSIPSGASGSSPKPPSSRTAATTSCSAACPSSASSGRTTAAPTAWPTWNRLPTPSAPPTETGCATCGRTSPP